MDFDLASLLPKNLNSLGEHITTYTNLYIKPIHSYRKAFSNRKNSLNFISLHAIYYTLILLLILFDTQLALIAVFAEIVSTIIPVLLFIAPFFLITKILKKNKSWINLFRVLLLIKLQNTPIIILLALGAKKIDEKFFYILLDNWAVLIVILYIISIPLIINISFKKKLIWGFSNYLSFIVMSAALGFIIETIDTSGNLLNKISSYSPSGEYYNSVDTDSASIGSFKDDSYIAIFDTVAGRLRNTQFATNELFLILIKRSYNQNLRQLNIQDSLLTVENPGRQRRKLSGKPYKENITVSLQSLDSIRESFNNRIKHDTSLFKIQKDSLHFKMNRNYALLRYKYLKHMDSTYTNYAAKKSILLSSKVNFRVGLDSNNVVVVMQLDSAKAYRQKNIILQEQKELIKFFDRSSILLDLFFYPVYKISNLLQ